MAARKKYTGRTLKKAVLAYLESIRRETEVTQMQPTGDLDRYGHPIMEPVKLLNGQGEPVLVLDYIDPPTVGSLCRRLGIHRATWAEYANEDTHPDMAEAVTIFRDARLAYLERELLTRDGKDVRGVEFDLQQNHGAALKLETEIGPKTVTAAASLAGLTLADKAALLEELRREAFEEGD